MLVATIVNVTGFDSGFIVSSLPILQAIAYALIALGAGIGGVYIARFQWTRAQIADYELREKKAHSKLEVDIYEHTDRIADRIEKQLRDRRLLQPNAMAPSSSEAMERIPAVLFPTLFGERFQHSDSEKRKLGQFLFKLLITRVEHLICTEDRRVMIVIDSGTTLFPLFELFGRWASRHRISFLTAKKDWWGRHLRLVTNSIAGIESLSLAGRLAENDRYSEVVCRAELIAGTPLAVYSATVGPLAQRHLEDLKNLSGRDIDVDGEGSEDRDPYIIALTTGNYIFLEEQMGKVKSVARGTGHREFKEALCQKSDEVFVVGPLGKFVVERKGATLAEFNNTLGYEENHYAPRMRTYADVRVEPEVRDNMHVLTTYRPNNAKVFARQSIAVEERLLNTGKPVVKINTGDDEQKIFNRVIGLNLSGIGHIMLKFEDLPDDYTEQLKQELPHENVRRQDIRQNYFNVR